MSQPQKLGLIMGLSRYVPTKKSSEANVLY